MFKYKVGDQVQVTTGKDKSKKGKIEKVLTKENKIIVSGVNLYKRHRKVSANQPAGIYEITRPMLASKVAIICPKCNKLTRVGFKIEGKTKVRVCKKCKGQI
ncbi:MAG TPA: 50S ribosomal protein L24 [Candidatus Saccharimonadales bacterium]|nr:50S ribosomal protein L24 [Candidatus Saccharimonadales bacterium]